jgi:hypothetical protein
MCRTRYLPVIHKYMAGMQSRGTSAYQTSDEVAAVVIDCIESPDPPIRIRTSPWAEDICQLKTASDPDGKKMQRKVVEMFLGG